MAYASVISPIASCDSWCTVIQCNNSSTLKTGYQADSSAAEGNGGCEMKQTDKSVKKRKNARRGNPYPTATKKGSSWTAMYYVEDSLGKKKQKYKRFSTEQSARDFLIKLDISPCEMIGIGKVTIPNIDKIRLQALHITKTDYSHLSLSKYLTD